MQSVTFFNWSNEDFICTWDGVPYLFKAGEMYKDTLRDTQGGLHLMERGVVETFARHLADREMAKDKVDVRRAMRGDDLYESYINKALVPATPEPVKAEAPVETPKKKMGRPKKVVEPVKEPTEEII